MARPPLLSLDSIALTFGGQPLLESANLQVFARDRVCLVGRNGSGKSTFLKIAAGRVEPDAGERFVKPGTTWRYLEQDPDMSGFNNLEDYVRDGLTGADNDARVPYLLDALGVKAQADPATASGGERRRAAIARVLAPEPDIMFLDEPTNHLDLPTIQWLEDELARSSAALVLISHDRRFLEATTRRTVWLDRGETRELDRNFAEFEDWRDQTLEQEELDRHKLARKIVREEHWVTHGVSGRRKRNMRRMGELSELKAKLRDARGPQGTARLSVTEGNKSGKRVVEFFDVSKAYGGRPLVEGLSLKIARGDRLAIIGPNGTGKTTLIKLMTGEIEPDSGRVETGSNLEPLIVDQSRDSLPGDTSLGDALTGGGTDGVEVGGQTRHVIAYMKDFLFLPEQRRTILSKLSGGERARVQLARGLRSPSNLLVLDEPTNDLDLETLDLLQELVAEYAGTVILVSHDRDFIDRTATKTLAWESDGTWTLYAGGYTDMVAQRGYGVRQDTSETVKPKPVPTSGKSSKPSKAKLSYKYQHRLDTLPNAMDKVTAKIEALDKQLAQADYFSRDPDGFARDAKALETARAELDAMEMEWLEIEEMKEALN